MDEGPVVDLSAEDCNDEALRKRINRKKMNELRKYIPFLEYISQLDPVKHHNFTQLLRWLKLNTEFPARMADTCEKNIIIRYNKIRNTTELPAHIVEVFTEKDAILISDEEDYQPTKKSDAHASKNVEIITLDDDEPVDSPKGTSSTDEMHDTQIPCATASRLVEPHGITTEGGTIAQSSPKITNSTIGNQSGTQKPNKCTDDSTKLALEEGEILSDGDEVKEDRQDTEPNKAVRKITVTRLETIFSTPSEDDIINQDLFKRIDSFEEENCSKGSLALPSKENEEGAITPILRQKNLEKALFSRRSPKKTRSDSLSTISSEDTLRINTHKKKKKKHKHKKKSHNQADWYVSEVENQSERGEKVIKTKIYRKDPSREEEKRKKPKKSSKKYSKEQKQTRLLYISDDEDVSEINKNTSKSMLSGNSNGSASPCEPPTVVLSDSNEEEVSEINSRQEKNIDPRTEPEVEEEKVLSPRTVETASHEEVIPEENTTRPSLQLMRDINSMNLNELNDIYVQLCDATGIQLEELLTDLVGKSTLETQQTPQAEVPRAIEVVAQTNFERISSKECPNQDSCSNNLKYQEENQNMFAFQQHRTQSQQNHTQVYQTGALDHFQQQLQLPPMNMQCQRQPAQLPYQHSLRPGLNLNDPRIVQRLKQIKDSPIHNINIRETATLLMNRHVALIPQRPSPVAEVTSRTATTYGEHKRLRELERKREAERQATKAPTMTKNQSSGNIHIVEKEITRVTKNDVDKNDKNTVKESRRSLSESSVGEENNVQDTELPDKTVMSFPMSKLLSRSPSPSEDSLLSSGKKTKSKDNITSGRITPFEVEKVVNIVLEAIGPVNADTSKRLKRLSSQLESRRNSCQDDDACMSSDLLAVPSRNDNREKEDVVDTSVENKDGTTKTGQTRTKVKRTGRPLSKRRGSENLGSEKSNSKRLPSKLHGIRELNNLNCTFLEYQEIFRKNSLKTNGGKRRCINSSRVIRDQSSDEASRYSDDTVPAAPINRRRKTCSALNDNPKPKEDNQAPIKVVFRRLSEGGTFGIENTKETHSAIEAKKKQKKNQNAFHKVKVMVRKLSFDEIKIKTNRTHSKNQIRNLSEATESNNSPEEPILVPISSVDCLSQTKVNPRLSQYLNNDINMTLNSTKICAICNKRSLDLTSHYVQQHKTESFISRLTTSEIQVLEREIKLATLKRKRYRTTCVFCHDELEVHQFVQFYAHFSYHTGEYGFKCNVCEVLKPYREDIKSHQHRTSRCRNGKIRTNYLYQSDLKVIYLYICKLCNFVQLNEANVHKHQRDHHSFRFEAPQNVKKCIICALDDTEVINEFIPPTEMESLGAGMEYTESNEDSPQDFLQECPLDIKDVLLNLANDNNLENSSNVVASKVSDKKEKVNPVSTPNSVSQVQDMGLTNNQMTVAQKQEICSPKATNKESAPEHAIKLILSYSSPSNIRFVENLCNIEASTIAETCIPNEKVSISAHPSPEMLVEQLHTCGEPKNVMTVVHVEKPAPCVERHKPYEETPDIKPNISKIKVDNPENLENSVPSPSPVKQVSYRRITPGTNYFGLYKCMISDCWFSTNEAEKYIRHVQTHKVNGQQQVLCCAYCSSKHTCAKLSVKHIRTRHSMSCYQCSACTYRSVVSANVSFHLDMYHKDITEEKCIFKCVGRVRPREDKLAALKEKMRVNVNRFACEDCSVQYYSLSLMKSHIETTQHNVQTSALLKYACMFCKVKSNSLEEMRVHLVTLHPNDACWIVERELNNPVDGDSIENLKWVNMALSGMNDIKIRVADFKEELEPVKTTNKIELDIIERIKPLLELITEKTGVYRADLYKCTYCSASFFTYELWLNHVQSRHGISETITCPYCPQQLTLEEVVHHFESHLHHEYICLHCIKTFGTKLELEDHFDANHKNFVKSVGRPIVYSNSRKYYIMKGEEGPSEWIPILQGFADILRKLCIEKLYENRSSYWCFEIRQCCFEDIDIPQFVAGPENILKCLVKSCAFEAPNENDFILHLNQHTVPHSYDCPYCGKIVETSWECILYHHMLHRSNAFHICCVCKFVHHNRSAVTEHIKEFHNSRDVPILTLSRDTYKCKVSASIVIPANKMGFVTTTTCFCCGQGMTDGKGVMSHLIDAHGVAVCRKCELCACILLNRKEAEEHRKEHGSTDFIIRYDILSSSSSNLSVDSISPFRIDIKRAIEKRLSEVETDLPSKRAKLDEFSLNIKQEVNKSEEDNVNMNLESSFEKPSCSIKCVNINQLVSSTTNITPVQPTPGLINIKSIEDLQSQNLSVSQTNTSDYHIEKNSTVNDKGVAQQQILQLSNSTHSTYRPPHQQLPDIARQPTQLINSQLFSDYNIQCFPPNEHHPVEEPQQASAIQNAVPQCYFNNNIQSEEHQPAVFQSVIRKAVRQPLVQQRPRALQLKRVQHPTTFLIKHPSSFAAQPRLSITTQHPSLFPAQFKKNQPKSLAALQSQSNIMSITLPNSQGIVTVSSGLPALSSSSGQPRSPQLQSCSQSQNNVATKIPNNPGLETISNNLPPVSATSYSSDPHCTYQSSDALVPSGVFQTNSLENYNQIVQTMEEIANTVDLNCPELLPICGNCQLECSSFIMLLSHFNANHEGQHRFTFRVERRVECCYCKYRGSIPSFSKHNSTFHPGQAFLCKSIFDHTRCGICNGVFNIKTFPNSATFQQCDCPTYKRVLSDCLNLDTLKLLQKYGRKFIGRLCEICKKVFHSEAGCLNHIRNIHNHFDILPKKFPLNDLVFLCYECEKTSPSVQSLILHIGEKHNLNSSNSTPENRLTCYKKIRVIYPRGLMVSLGSLCNAGYSEECLKKDIETVDATLVN